MSTREWLERLLDTVADHGLDLIGLRDREARIPSDSELCHRLVDGLGEASNVALAREILQRWQVMDDSQKVVFLNMMAAEMDPDPTEILAAAGNYRARDPDSLRQLQEICEPPRQELFRRLNMAPNGTADLVSMRTFLLGVLDQYPELRSVDDDMHHLFNSWFNRGFLRLERIDWNSPAAILEKLIRYEAVHPMQGWQDLRRRLGPDRRCFAFFHPALPLEPLIFVEVALTQSISQSIAPLIDPVAPETNPLRADTAVFYSINNALKGLKGVSFGNFLIKQVMSELGDEYPSIKTFVTLSPIPYLSQVSMDLMSTKEGDGTRDTFSALLGERVNQLVDIAGQRDPVEAIGWLLQNSTDAAQRIFLDDILRDITLYYLTFLKKGDYAHDPVAHFHLSNGARLERINLHANVSDRGVRQSWGCMVNYRYQESDVIKLHEDYVGTGSIALSPELERRRENLLEHFYQ